MAKLGAGSGGSWIRYKDDGGWEEHKHEKVRGTVKHMAVVGVVGCMGWDVAEHCSAVMGILFRVSMYYLTATAGDFMSSCFPNLSCFLLVPGATLWHSDDHELASSHKWTKDREERSRLER